MKRLLKKVSLLALFIGLSSCFSNKYEYKGEKPIINKKDWVVKFYQLDEFEMITPIDYEIVSESGKVILERQGLTGDSNLQNVNDFYAKVQDSIFYICYPYPQIMAIKHISNLDKPNQWDLIRELHKRDTALHIGQGKQYRNLGD